MRNSMYNLDQELDALIEAYKKSDIYQKYLKCRAILLENPELKAQVDEFRKKNFEMQNQEDDGTLEERVQQLSDSYLWLTEQPVVRSFLDAELAFCRMMQETTDYVLANIEFD